jgi:hypothetical protein
VSYLPTPLHLKCNIIYGKNVAVRLNYNGKMLILKKSEIRVVTSDENNFDPKLHRREAVLTADEMGRLNYSI